jgi:hypothetical protein
MTIPAMRRKFQMPCRRTDQAARFSANCHARPSDSTATACESISSDEEDALMGRLGFACVDPADTPVTSSS